MVEHRSSHTDGGLERSCAGDWLRISPASDGVERLEARFAGHAYDSHRHHTYAIGVTDDGVQAFNYRGAEHVSTAGKVVVLHPDELHDGHAGADGGFSYRMVYVEPARIAEAVRALRGGPRPLPFVGDAVSDNAPLADAVRAAFGDDPEPLAIDTLVLRLAEGLLAGAGDDAPELPGRFDEAAVTQARALLDAADDRVVRTAELEAVSGLGRYDLARQFRTLLGTSPYRYSLMRRLEHARRKVTEMQPLADVALAAGFADQAHFTRQFKAAYGMTPANFRRLTAVERGGDG